MLPAAARLRAAADFAAAVRSGRRGASPTLVVHLHRTDRLAEPRAGFVVSKKVGNSVIRHRVTRRLRPLVRARLSGLPAGVDVVVRALPAAAAVPSARLSADLATALRAAARRAGIEGITSVVSVVSVVTVSALVGSALPSQVGVVPRRTSPPAWLLIQPIRFYQRFITPYTPATCRYYPTCSSYAVRALRTHGAVKGLVLTAWRLLRCNPWSSGGVDHVPPRGRWRPDPDGAGCCPTEATDASPVAGSAPDPVTADGASPAGDPGGSTTPIAERRAGPDRSVTDLSCNAQPGTARAPIAGSTAA